jgi:hypothetical protein
MVGELPRESLRVVEIPRRLGELDDAGRLPRRSKISRPRMSPVPARLRGSNRLSTLDISIA